MNILIPLSRDVVEFSQTVDDFTIPKNEIITAVCQAVFKEKTEEVQGTSYISKEIVEAVDECLCEIKQSYNDTADEIKAFAQTEANALYSAAVDIDSQACTDCVYGLIQITVDTIRSSLKSVVPEGSTINARFISDGLWVEVT